MATRKKAAPAVEELDELEELEEVIEEVDPDEAESETEGLSAKAVATRLGVDARTFRKFLRSKYGKVGQGNRWLLDEDDFEDLKAEFLASKAKATEKKAKAVTPPADDDEAEELDAIDFDEELEELSID